MMTIRLVIAVMVIMCAGGCAHARPALIVADTALVEALSDVHATEQHMLCGLPSCATSDRVEFVTGWTRDRSEAFNRRLLPAVEAGRQFTSLLRGWNPREPAPPQLHTLIVSLADSVRAVLAEMPDGTTRTAILTHLREVQGMVLLALDLALGGAR